MKKPVIEIFLEITMISFNYLFKVFLIQADIAWKRVGSRSYSSFKTKIFSDLIFHSVMRIIVVSRK